MTSLQELSKDLEQFDTLDLPDRDYKFFTIKSGSKTRGIWEPNPGLKQYQKLIGKVAAKYPTHECCHSRPGRSTLTNAAMHVGSKVIYKADIKNFFDSVNMLQIWDAGYEALSENNVTILAEPVNRKFLDVTINGHCYHPINYPTLKGLATGAPSSPALSNISMFFFDRALQELATIRGYTYTRYFDDLTFSHKEMIIDEDLAIDIDTILYATMDTVQLHLNKDKSRWILPDTHEPYEITGISIHNGIPQPPRGIKRLVRSMLDHKASGQLESDTVLNGYLAYISMIDEDYRERLDNYYQERCEFYGSQHT